MKGLTKWILLPCLLAFTGLVSAELVKIATWNIEDLRAENNVGAVKRTDEDYAALSAIAREIDADIIALQEVDGPEAAARVFDPAAYGFFFSDRNNVQRTGFAVRKGIEVVADEDFVALSLDGRVRRGTDITVKLGDRHLRLLSVHLKSGCIDDPLNTDSRNCRKLATQLSILEEWIDEREEEGIPFIILGDFNRRFDAQGEGFFSEMDDGELPPLDLVRAIEGRDPACRGGQAPLYIDYIVFDEQAADFLVPDSFEQVQISEEDDARFALSDQCPIAVLLDVVSAAGPTAEEEAETAEEKAEQLVEEIRALVRQTNEKVEELHRMLPALRD